VEVDRSKLVAAFLSQSTMLVNKQCDSAMGGILYIHGANELISGEKDEYGKEAINALLMRMEDNRGKFVVIISGYSKEMKAFLQSNPGLKSRFTDCIDFDEQSQQGGTQAWVSKGGKACTSPQEIALALEAESTYYMEDLKNPNANLYQYFKAVEGAQGVEISEVFLKYFSTYPPDQALTMICSMLKDN
jgi:hypothetical protein